MWTRAELKARGRKAFFANYWKCLLVAIILVFISSAGSSNGRDDNQNTDQNHQYEQTVGSIKLNDFRPVPGRKYALIFGNEVDGVQQDVVDASDFSLEIPQWGTKHSLNVSVSVGVILWHFRLFIK